MAKSGKRRGTRDAPQSLTVSLRSQPVVRPSSRLLAEIEDLRSFSFEAARPRTLSTRPASFSTVAVPVKRPGKKGRKMQFQVAFSAPSETLVCVRRSRRKEVLFAKKKTGKKGQRKARWSRFSNVRCK